MTMQNRTKTVLALAAAAFITLIGGARAHAATIRPTIESSFGFFSAAGNSPLQLVDGHDPGGTIAGFVGQPGNVGVDDALKLHTASGGGPDFGQTFFNGGGLLDDGNSATITNAASTDGGQRASVFLDSFSITSDGWSAGDLIAGTTATGMATASGTSFSGTVSFNESGRLNGTYGGTLSATAKKAAEALGAIFHRASIRRAQENSLSPYSQGDRRVIDRLNTILNPKS
ncbi:MAG: hypothetical protein MK171_04805 [Pirellulales bacterium]|nr:hypothetical protein [Pirellulales bacterium]